VREDSLITAGLRAFTRPQDRNRFTVGL